MPRGVVIVGEDGMPETLEKCGLWAEGVPRRTVSPNEVETLLRENHYGLLLMVVREPSDLEWCLKIREVATSSERSCVALLRNREPGLRARLHEAGFPMVIDLPYEPILWDSRLRQLLSVPSRRAVRVPVRLRVWASSSWGGPVEGTTVDVSMNGMLIEASDPLPLAVKLDIELEEPVSGEAIELFGEVVRVLERRGQGHRIAIEFIEGRGGGRRRLGDWLEPSRARPEAPEASVLERELRASEVRLRTIVGTSYAGVLCFEAEGRIVEMNAAAEGILHASPRELGLPGALEQRLSPELRNEVDRQLERLASGRASEAPPLLETWIRRDGGEKIPVEAALCPSFLKDRPFLTLWFRDISARIRREEERRRLVARIASKQRLESLGLVAGTAAHDFNNLLLDVIGHASLARAQLADDHPAVRSLTAVQQASHRAREIIERFLASAGRRPGIRSPVDLASLVREAIEMTRGTAPESVAIRWSVGPEIPGLDVDPTRIAQMLLNLLHNAVEALPEGGGRVEVTVEAVPDEEVVDGSAGFRAVRIAVRDDGCGMDEATRSRIFEPFFTTKNRGHGLGLAGVADIIAELGGVFDVTSAPGEGTVFAVELPVGDGPS